MRHCFISVDAWQKSTEDCHNIFFHVMNCFQIQSNLRISARQISTSPTKLLIQQSRERYLRKNQASFLDESNLHVIRVGAFSDLRQGPTSFLKLFLKLTLPPSVIEK